MGGGSIDEEGTGGVDVVGDPSDDAKPGAVWGHVVAEEAFGVVGLSGSWTVGGRGGGDTAAADEVESFDGSSMEDVSALLSRCPLSCILGVVSSSCRILSCWETSVMAPPRVPRHWNSLCASQPGGRIAM